MILSEAKELVKTRIKCTDYLEPSKDNMYCCPACNSGHKKNKTGAVEYKPNTNKWRCYSCGRRGDVISLYQIVTGKSFKASVIDLAESIGITVDSSSDYKNGNTSPKKKSTPQKSNAPQTAENPSQEATEPAPPPDYSSYYLQCFSRLSSFPEAVEYLNSRGISLETAQSYFIGYDPYSDPANAPAGEPKEDIKYPTPRIIIPSGKSFYMGRSIYDDVKLKKANAKGSKIGIFNLECLYKEDISEVFVTEGAFDALSILEVGYHAIALNSAGNYKELLAQLKKERTSATLILCLDKDERGRKDEKSLKEGLRNLDIPCISADICGQSKDPNESLVRDTYSFISLIESAIVRCGDKPDNTSSYIDNFMSEDIAKFRYDKQTGFEMLDRKSGGLYAGLYVLAAISSLGKTTFALQIADQLAMRGEDVIFFSLEQSKLELVSKSICRTNYSLFPQTPETAEITSLRIRKGKLQQRVIDSANKYKGLVGDRMSIVESNLSCNTSYICDYIRDYIKRTDKRPVVFLDYLQILSPEEDDTKGKQVREIVDYTTRELKRLSRELGLTIVAISSVNRANYLTPIDFESLKESGGIEYTADVIWGLQLQCLNDNTFSSSSSSLKEKREKVRQAKMDIPRKVELRCLKNRYGIASFSCFYDYYPSQDLFIETEDESYTYTPPSSVPKAGRSSRGGKK